MLSGDIEIGKTYNINSYGISKGIVKDGPSKRGRRRVYSFLIECEPRVGGEKTQIWIESRNITREWTAEDEARMESDAEARVKIEAMRNALVFAGYPEATIHERRNSGLWLQFKGDDAERVFKILTSSED